MITALLVHPADTVAVCLTDAAAGECVKLSDGRELTAVAAVPRGHKIAVQAHAAGARVLKYGEPIGHAGTAIEVGEHVHTHNLVSDRARRPAGGARATA
jgi:altronate hydrolase